MGLFSGRTNQPQKETKHWMVTVKSPSAGKVKLGIYAESNSEAQANALSYFPDGKVVHISKK